MPRYRKIDPRVFGDEQFREMTPPHRLAWFTLLCHPLMTPMGAGVMPTAVLDDVLGFTRGNCWLCQIESADECCHSADLSLDWFADRRMILRDKDLVVVSNFLLYNTPDSPNTLAAWVDACEELPRSKAFAELRDRLRTSGHALPEWLFTGLLNPLAEQKNRGLRAEFWSRTGSKPAGRPPREDPPEDPSPDPSKDPSKDPSHDPYHDHPSTQEQEQEQYQEQEERSKAGNGVATAAVAPLASSESLKSLEPGTATAKAETPTPAPLPPAVAALSSANGRKRKPARGGTAPQGVRFDAGTGRLIVPRAAREIYRQEFPEFDIDGEVATAQRHLDTLKARGERLRHKDGSLVKDVAQWFTRRLTWERDIPFDHTGAKIEFDVESGEYVQ